MKARGTHELLKVAFDASALKSRYNHHGIQVYTRNLLVALARVAQPCGMEIRPFLPSDAESISSKFAEGPGFHLRRSSLMRFDRLWRYGGATAAAFLDSADIMLTPTAP